MPDNHRSGIKSKQNEESIPIYEDSNFYYIQLYTCRTCHRLHISKSLPGLYGSDIQGQCTQQTPDLPASVHCGIKRNINLYKENPGVSS